MPNPKAVIISDIHYSIQTLELADAAMRQAITKANDLNVLLIVAGDLHDTKANLRGECMNAMIETFKLIKTNCVILRGNHDSLNEKAKEHSLTFLNRHAFIVDNEHHVSLTTKHMHSTAYCIAYQHDQIAFKSILDNIPKGSTIIMHQGVHGSKSGEYIQDKSAIPSEWLAGYRVISGHYHTRQDIKCGRPQKGAVGLMSYIGNPYTLNFAEANDPEKGFQILMDDGTLEFVPTNLRKHVVIEMTYEDIFDEKYTPNEFSSLDIVKVKLTGTKEQLNKVTKNLIQGNLGLGDFKLELIPLETSVKTTPNTQNLTRGEILDKLIDSTSNVSDEQKTRIKELWKGMI